MEGIVLPYLHLNDADFNSIILELNSNYSIGNDAYLSIDQLDNILFDQFSNDRNNLEVFPDNNYYNSFCNSINQCKYILPEQINDETNNAFFSCCHININSVPKNLSNFQIECLDGNSGGFDVVALCETKLTSDIEHLYDINNYTRYYNSKSRKSGGVALYIKNEIKKQILLGDFTRCSDTIESLFVQMEINNQKVICGVIYHRPGSSHNEFINELNLILNELMKECKYIYIMGDFNINLLKSRENTSCSLIDLFHSFGIFNLINKPTRISKNTSTLIDHIWSNCFDRVKKNGIIFSHITDHFPIFSLFDIKSSNSDSNSDKEYYFRNFSDENLTNFKLSLEQVSWDLVFAASNADVAYENFILIFKNIFEKNFPLVRRTVKNNNHVNKPYVDSHLKELIREKNKIQKKFSKKPLTFGTQYKEIRNKVNSLVRKSKNRYYQTQLNNSANDIKKTWNVLNGILNRKNNEKLSCTFKINNETIDDPQIIAQAFNQYYVKAGVNLAESIINDDNINFIDYLGQRSDCELNFGNVTVANILSIVEDLNDSAAGCDGMPASIIKKVIGYIVEPFCHICNCTLDSGIFPTKLKIAKVSPIYKKDCKNDLKNYRPISVLPVFSKIIEKVINIQLIHYLETNNLLNRSQFGFRAGMSTTAAALNLCDYVLSAFDRKQFAVGIFLDLRKAFETVNHDILLQKLDHIGIRNNSYNLFKDYLTDRSQYVVYNSFQSNPDSIKCSVPQGSILGPVLFLIYINDIKNSLNYLNNVLFADDTCLFASNKNIEVLIESVNQDLRSVNNWLKANKLSLNIEKSNYIIFNRRKKIPPDIPNIMIDNVSLKKVPDINFLGFQITSNLSWNLHIKFISNKINKIRRILFLIRDSLTKSSKIMIYNSLVYPNLIYGNVLWGKAPKSIMKTLIVSQKRLIRTIMNVNVREHTNNLFIELKILKIDEINYYCTSLFVFKSINNMIFPRNYFNYNNNNLRNANELGPTFVPSGQSQSSPKYYGCLMWNSLPDDVKSANSIITLKRKLKEYLLSLYLDA